MNQRANTDEDFWAKVQKSGPDDCWPWTRKRNSDGYGLFARRGFGQKGLPRWYAHRMAWALAKGDPGEMCVLHSCDNPPCCNPAHLFLGTRSDNNRDRDLKGRRRNGGPGGKKKLTAHDVREIRTRYSAGGVSQHRLGVEYGVHQTTILAVLRRKTWEHVDTQEAR